MKPRSSSRPSGIIRRWEVAMANAEGMVGADIDHQNFTATRLRVLAICRGSLLAKFNAEHPDSAVEPGDYIVAVNGVHSDAGDMVQQFGRVGELRVVLERRLPGLFERGLAKAVHG